MAGRRPRHSDGLTNRDLAHCSKPTIMAVLWCGRCDANLVRIGDTCSVCGQKNGERRKKPKNLPTPDHP